MNEQLLVRAAFFLSIAGFIGLSLLVFFEQPLQSSPQQSLLTSFQATITEIYHTGNAGSVVVYTVEESGYIDTPVNTTLVGRKARITGRLEGDFFSIASIEVLAPNDHS